MQDVPDPPACDAPVFTRPNIALDSLLFQGLVRLQLVKLIQAIRAEAGKVIRPDEGYVQALQLRKDAFGDPLRLPARLVLPAEFAMIWPSVRISTTRRAVAQAQIAKERYSEMDEPAQALPAREILLQVILATSSDSDGHACPEVHLVLNG